MKFIEDRMLLFRESYPFCSQRTETCDADAPLQEVAASDATVSEKAMDESRVYFEMRYRQMQETLRTHRTEILTLIKSVQGGKYPKVEDIMQALGLESMGVAEAILRFLQKEVTIANFLTPGQLLPILTNFLEEKFHPSAQMQEVQRLFSAGQGWYHTTAGGRARLKAIKAGVGVHS